ncbi:MAG: hypothetical protein HRU78_04295 [Gammaproteobacteria bacterium]|nr:MAG: hypothetical protein HRU78_04295 [Gammaproteobacteria bacterium]
MAALMAGYLQADLSPAMRALRLVQDGAKDKAQEKESKQTTSTNPPWMSSLLALKLLMMDGLRNSIRLIKTICSAGMGWVI